MFNIFVNLFSLSFSALLNVLIDFPKAIDYRSTGVADESGKQILVSPSLYAQQILSWALKHCCVLRSS